MKGEQNMVQKKPKRPSGFTITELVIVIAVIAVLAAVLIPTFSGMIVRANESALKQDALGAYLEYIADNADKDGVSNMFIYSDGNKYVAIKDGQLLDGVFTSSDEAKQALIFGTAFSNYTLNRIKDSGLYSVEITPTIASFANSSISVEQEQTADENGASLSLYYQTLKIGSVEVPADAVADPSAPVKVTLASQDPADSISDKMTSHTKAYGYDIKVSNLKAGENVTVTLQAPTALPVVSVYHDGEEINAEYDEHSGAITFETDSFSPYIISYEEYEVATVEQLREAVAIDGAYIKLTADITSHMNKGVENNDCDMTHSWECSTGGDNLEDRYYFLTLVTGVDVSVDLNGHTIEVIDQLEDGYLYCMGVFVVDKGSNINILDSAGNGKIKLNGPMFGVWAPYPANTSTDIYGGIFMSDSYVGDNYGWGISA